MVQALLRIHTKDNDVACRKAARDVLSAIPLSANIILPLLSISTHEPCSSMPSRLRKRTRSMRQVEEQQEQIDGKLKFRVLNKQALTVACS
jgi:hypothetical protein